MEIEDSFIDKIKPEIILENVMISAMDISLDYIIYSTWDSNKIKIFSIKTKIKKDFLEVEEENFVNSIVVIKSDGMKFLFIALSSGKLLFYKFISK